MFSHKKKKKNANVSTKMQNITENDLITKNLKDVKKNKMVSLNFAKHESRFY